MTQDRLDAQERAIVIAQQDQLRPVPARRQDTGELFWIVPSRRDPTRSYLLTREGEEIRCPCPHFQQHGICAHAAAVRLLLQVPQQKRSTQATPRRTLPPFPASKQGVQSRTEEECQRHEAALRRERALLWTDDKPFSIWKS